MERHRERMEITLSGGKPWGFSIKGGTHQSRITISKLEPYGKGEASGLVIGDVITCVNDVSLTGNRREAVEMIKRSGDRLLLAVERSFRMNTIDMPTQGRQLPPSEGYISDPRYREPVSPTMIRPKFHGSNHHQTGWHNERNSHNNNSMNDNQPVGYHFTNSSSNKLRQQQQVKETLKMVIAEKKRDGLINSPPDIIRDRLSEKTRRSTTSSSTGSDPSERTATRQSITSSSTGSDPSERQTNQPNSSGVRHRHGNKDSGERPRSWHASKHPENEHELKQTGLSSGDRGQPAPRSRRKSREWLESEDLRSTLDRNSSESLLTSSTEQLLMENGEANPPQPPPRTHHGICRDRSSINSNPSLLDAFQAPLRSGSFDYESPQSALSHRSSQDSLNSSSISIKSYRPDCPSSDSKNNVRIDGSVGNRLRSSGRYGEIWKMPQVHRRAKSFDALSEDTPRQKGGGGGGSSRSRRSIGHSQPESAAGRTGNAPPKSQNLPNENLLIKSPGIRTDDGRSVKSPILKNNEVHPKSPGFKKGNIPPKSPVLKTEIVPQTSSSPIKSRSDHLRFQHHRSDKRRHVDALISTFEKSKAPNDDHKSDKTIEGRHLGESKSIITQLRHHSASSSFDFSARQHDNGTEKATPEGNDKYSVQSSGSGVAGLYSESDDFKTLPSRSDEYRKNIQGMSKKVLRVTSFTRKDLELSPPYQAPVHQPKGFGFPPPPPIKQERRLLSAYGNGPVRSKSTSSLLDTVVPSSVVNIPVTHEETNLLRGKQYCKSLSPSPPSVGHHNMTVEKPKDPLVHREDVIQNIGGRVIKRITTGPRNNGLTKVPEFHCEDKNNENEAPPDSFNHTDLQIKSPPPVREKSLIHDIKPAPTAPTKLPSIVPIKEEKDDPATEIPQPPVTKPSPLSTLPTTQNTPALSNHEMEHKVTPTSSSVTSSSYSDIQTASSPLPATSAYYQTSASKAKIIHLIQEKFEGGEVIDLENIETEEERNERKIELLKRITQKLADLQRMKDMLKTEVNENEQLGKTVKQLAEQLCSPREHERFKTFVEEIDKIFNLLFSISGRLARVENTLATLPEDADAEEKKGLLEKQKKLTSQHEEAILLKENVDRRQENVSKILAVHFSADEYSDFEHYIKMKTALISEQREVDDKMRLGEEQMSELHNSLPEPIQEKYPLSEQYEAFKTLPGQERQGSEQPS